MRLTSLTLTIFYNFVDVTCLTCSRVLELPSDTTWTLEILKTIPPKDTVECLAHLAKERLPPAETEYIWNTVISYHGGIENIPDSSLMVLHWVTPAVKPEQYANITFDNIDVIQNFGLNYELDDERLAALADGVRRDFAGKRPEQYTYYDLTALGQILCAFNASEVERIRPAAYREAARALGRLRRCAAPAMRALARLAAAAFGAPARWSAATRRAVGAVALHVPGLPARETIGDDPKDGDY